MRKNILFSTTRQWNPGDEFILLGCINLLKELYPGFNPVIYNRNPAIRQEKYSNLNFFRNTFWERVSCKSKGLSDAFLRMGFFDNSFKDNTDASFLDLAVFAGSPEWYGYRNAKLYDVINRYNIPAVYLGIGLRADQQNLNLSELKAVEIQTLKNAKLIITRDTNLAKSLNAVNAVQMPCPALFSVSLGKEKEIKKVKKIGLIYGCPQASPCNNISRETYTFLISLYKQIIKQYSKEYEIGLVCHYIDEMPSAARDFPGMDISYSYDAKDYREIFSRFDLVIGHRIHGIGMSASLAIPGIALAHDLRADTLNGFKAKIINKNTSVQDIFNLIDKTTADIIDENELLKKHKQNAWEKYIALLKERLAQVK